MDEDGAMARAHVGKASLIEQGDEVPGNGAVPLEQQPSEILLGHITIVAEQP